MATINVYLTFNGNCREAMLYYKRCFGGLLTLETVKGSPMESSWPKQTHNNILHAQLVSDAITILGSDMIEQDGLTVGNNVTLALVCKTDFEIENYFIKLSHEGTIKYPLHDFYGGKIGGIIDKFGIHWLLKF
ncbi:MAG: VOC family protein [Bacteroidota bacterium]